MRIIAGQWRSRRLERPESDRTRPMPDRVKESIFNVLGTHFGMPGMLPELRVADVFAGSGSMGLEALSRGAEQCCFYERNAMALAALRRNIESLGAVAAARIMTTDAWSAPIDEHCQKPFDLILLDPPYVDAEDASPAGRVRTFLGRLATGSAESALDAPGQPRRPVLVVLHHPAGTGYQLNSDDPWRIMDDRIIGSNRVTMFSHETA